MLFSGLRWRSIPPKTVRSFHADHNHSQLLKGHSLDLWLVTGSEWEPVWAQLVHAHHYLGCRNFFEELFQASAMRWPIKQCFEEGKSHLGMDAYEHRSWPAWHRHMIYVMLVQQFLFRLRQRFKNNSKLESR